LAKLSASTSFKFKIKIEAMKKLPKIELHQLTPYAVAVSVLGFCLMQTDDFKNIGAIAFSLGLLPLALMLSKHKD
jgi:Na+/phosphate symporter